MIDACSIIKHPKYDAAKATLSEFLQSESAAVAALVKNGGDLTSAPNGQPSKLYADAYAVGEQLYDDPAKFAATVKAITLTDAFKNWFNGSQIIDENGEPLIVWHKSTKQFSQFNLNESAKQDGAFGYHFGTKNAAEMTDIFGQSPIYYPVFLNLKNPVFCTDEEQSNPGLLISKIAPESQFDLRVDQSDREYYTRNIGKILNQAGYDGVKYVNTIEDAGSISYIALDNNQIKSIQNTDFKEGNNIFYSREFLDREGYGNLILNALSHWAAKNHEGDVILDYNFIESEWLQKSKSLEFSGLYNYFQQRRPDLISFIQTIKFVVPAVDWQFHDKLANADFFNGYKAGFYDAATNTIWLNPEVNYPNGDPTQVIWHEIMHALTVNQLAVNKKARDYFRQIMYDYEKATGIDYSSQENAVEEFVANIWTDPELIRDLKKIKVGYKESLWQRIKNWFRKFFGSASSDSMFIQATAALDRLLELPIIQGLTSYRYNYTTAQNSGNIVRLLMYQYSKEGLSSDQIKERINAYLKGDKQELARAQKFLDYIQLRRAELHTLGKDFGQEKLTLKGYIDWTAYLHDIDLRKEIDENSDVSSFATLTNYTVEPAEIIVPKIYKSNFKLGNQDIAEITVDYFKKANPYYTSNLGENISDILIRTHNSKFNIVFVDSFSDNEFTKQLTKVSSKIQDGWRLNNNGDRMYQIPENLDYEIWVDKKGEETIVIKGKNQDIVDQAFKLINTTNNIVSAQLFANHIDVTDDLLYDITRINKIRTNNVALRQLTKLPSENRKAKLLDIYHKQEKQYKEDLANTLYNSFVKTLYMMSVRIPTQHFQSIMAAKVVGLTNDEDNNVFVNRWQFWLQGSDLDIDKSYMMGVDISPIGTFNHWSPLADYTTTELAKISDKLPVPTGNEIRFETNDEWGESATILATLSDSEEKINKIERLKWIVQLLNYAKKHNNTIHINFQQVNNRKVNQILKDLNRHSTHKLTAEESRNVIQNLIMQTSLDERNMKSSYSPIDDAMALFTDVLKKMSDPTSMSRNLDDGMLTIARIQFNNSVGKDDVGVMANGLKAFFALTQYFNKYRKSPDFIKKCAFLKRIKINGKTIDFCTISDIQLEQEAIKGLIEGLRSQGAIKSEDEIRFANDDAGLLISSLISLATDNAKELALAKMNASLDLACMHLYLAVLGCNANEIVEFATTPEFKELTKLISKSVLSKDSSSVKDVIAQWQQAGFTPLLNADIKLTLTKSNTINGEMPHTLIEDGSKTSITILESDKAWDSLKDLREGNWINLESADGKNTYSNYVKIKKITKLNSDLNIKEFCKKEGCTESYFNTKIKPNLAKAWQIEFDNESSPYEQENTSAICTVYAGAQEMTKLARLASVNQGVKVDILESTKFINNFAQLLQEGFASRLLDVSTLPKEYIASLKSVNMVNEDLQLLPINVLRYFRDSNYRQLCVDLYDFCKETFNILDVINNLPHFYKMLEAFAVSQETLKNLSSRSRTILNDTQIAYTTHKISNRVNETFVDEYTGEKRSVAKYPFKRVPFSERTYNKANKYYDDAIVSDWLQRYGEDYEIDYVDTKEQTIQVIPNTNKGVKEFCNLMAYTIIPELQAVYPNNGFLQHILPNFRKLKKSNDLWLPSYKFDFDIDSLLTVQDENKAFYVQKGFAKLADVKLSDLNLDIVKGENISVAELIYLYNKLTSFTGYGQNTLDAAFDDYLNQQFSKGNPTIAQSFSELILSYDTGQQSDIRIDPVKFLAFCYSDVIRRFQKGIMHYDYDARTKTEQQYNISDIYLFGLDKRPTKVTAPIQYNTVENVQEIEVTPENSNIDFNLLAKNIATLVVDRNGNNYTISSTNTETPITFEFSSDANIETIQDVISEAYKFDGEGLKLFLKDINTSDIKAKPLKKHQTVQTYKIFQKWMQEKFNIPVELFEGDSNIHGKVSDGKIYLNINSDITTTPIHELMHVVFEFMKQENFNTFERVVTDLTNSEDAQQILQELLQNPEYNSLMNLDLLAEVSCRILENMEQGKTTSTLSADISNIIMNNMAEMLGLTTNGRNLDLLSFLKDTISNLPSYNSMLLAELKPDRSKGYLSRINKIAEGMKISNIIEQAIKIGKLTETKC